MERKGQHFSASFAKAFCVLGVKNDLDKAIVLTTRLAQFLNKPLPKDT